MKQKVILSAICFFRKMNMAEDMLTAIAVVARAAGAVAERKVGIVRIRLAADAALMVPALLRLLFRLALCTLRFRTVMPRLRTAAVALPLLPASDVGREEHKKIEQCEQRQQAAEDVPAHKVQQNRHQEPRRVRIGEPLDLDGQNEEHQHLHIGIEGGKGEEEGQVYIIRPRHRQGIAAEKIADHGCENGQNHAAYIINSKASRAPLVFQRRTDGIVEIQRHRHPKSRAVGRNKDEGDEPPKLAVQHLPHIEPEKLQRRLLRKHGEQKHQHIADDDVAHQIFDAKARVHGAESVDLFIEFLQHSLPPQKRFLYCSPCRRKSH